MTWPLDPDVQVGDAGHVADTNSMIERLRTHDTMFTELSDTYVTQATAGLDVTVFGAVGDGVTDDTAAIQAAINALEPGQTLIFPPTGSGAWFNVTSGLTVTTPNVRFLGQPRDAYAASIRCSVPGVTILTVQAAGFVAQDLGIIGDGGVNGAGATQTGIDLYGSINADVDCALDRSTIQGCSVGVLVRGRNARVTNALFSNNSRGVVFDGLAAYHTGPSANSGNRGNSVENTRFHNNGTAAVDVTTTAKVLHARFTDNYVDSNGNGVHFRITGTVSNPHEKITIRDTKSTETAAVVYSLTYVNNSTIDGVDIAGNATAPTDANAFELNNCNTLVVRNVFGVQISGSGVYARNCSNLMLDGVKWRVLGMGSGPAAHGFDIDSTNTNCTFDNLRVENTDGWGFLGSPAASKIDLYEFRSCTLGQISSTTIQAERVFIPATAMFAITGTPNLAGVAGIGFPGAWHFDAASAEQVTGVTATLPGTWTTYDVYVVWSPTSTSTGNVVWDTNLSLLAEGALPSGTPTSLAGSTSAASGVTGTVTRYRAGAGQVRPSHPLVFRVTRNAAAAGDTYPSDAALIGVELVRVS